MARTRPLDSQEIRILGALLEKEQTTPDSYPLTLPALVAACNQKSNREPVTAYGIVEVEQIVDRLRQDVLVWQSSGARSLRFQHSLDRRWELDAASKALITLLMLRGPQTPGELRSRSERMHAFPDLESVENTLQAMAQRFDALVRELPRQPGQREQRWTHLLAADEPSFGSSPAEVGHVEVGHAEVGYPESSAPRPESQTPLDDRRYEAEAQPGPARGQHSSPSPPADSAEQRLKAVEKRLSQVEAELARLRRLLPAEAD